jgi:glycerophosphoryl diester phosphodiesterase
MTRPLVVAHRAGNHLDAMRAAERAGADLVEADVWMWHGRLEVRHTKTMGPVPLLWDRWLLAPGWTPRLQLEELIRAAHPDTEFMLDLKGTAPTLPDAVMETMARVAPGRPFTVASQTWAFLASFEMLNHVRVVYSIGNERMRASIASTLRDRSADGVGIHERMLTPARVVELHALAPLVFSWPINDGARCAELIQWGVNGVISDRYELLLQDIERWCLD